MHKAFLIKLLANTWFDYVIQDFALILEHCTSSVDQATRMQNLTKGKGKGSKRYYACKH